MRNASRRSEWPCLAVYWVTSGFNYVFATSRTLANHQIKVYWKPFTPFILKRTSVRLVTAKRFAGVPRSKCTFFISH